TSSFLRPGRTTRDSVRPIRSPLSSARSSPSSRCTRARIFNRRAPLWVGDSRAAWATDMTAIWEPSAADVEMIQLLDEKGIASAVAEYAEFFPDDDALQELYRLMVLARRIDEEAVRLQRQGELALYPPILGQEAAQVAGAYAFDREDWMFIGYRDLGPLIVRRVEAFEVMQFWRGTWHGGGWDPRSSHVAPYCAPVATQLPHSVGFALGEKLAGRRGVVGCYFGDGATSAGDFHEACNFAGVFQAPVVFICQNNHVALSVPLHRQTAAPAIAAKALGYGFRGV